MKTAIAPTIALLTLTGLTAGTAHASPSTSPDCTLKTWLGSPYAFCGATVCVSLDNRTNVVAYASSTQRGMRRYRERDSGLKLRALPSNVRPAYRMALAAVQTGAAGPKRVTACID